MANYNQNKVSHKANSETLYGLPLNEIQQIIGKRLVKQKYSFDTLYNRDERGNKTRKKYVYSYRIGNDKTDNFLDEFGEEKTRAVLAKLGERLLNNTLQIVKLEDRSWNEIPCAGFITSQYYFKTCPIWKEDKDGKIIKDENGKATRDWCVVFHFQKDCQNFNVII